MNEAAFPHCVNETINGVMDEVYHSGLTKRDYFACAVMQGLCHGRLPSGEEALVPPAYRGEIYRLAISAVALADALIAELKKEGER